MMTMSYSDFPAKSVSVLMRSVAFGDYHNEMTMVRTRTKTKIMTMTISYSEFPARPGSQVARLDFDIGAALVEGQRFWHSRFSLIWTTCSLHTALEEQFNLQIRKMYIWRLEHGCERLYRNTSCSQTLWNEEMWSVPYKKKCHTKKKVPYRKKCHTKKKCRTKKKYHTKGLYWSFGGKHTCRSCSDVWHCVKKEDHNYYFLYYFYFFYYWFQSLTLCNEVRRHRRPLLTLLHPWPTLLADYYWLERFLTDNQSEFHKCLEILKTSVKTDKQ